MTALSDNRKRSREDDNCDFMPLSKRINNLHINTQVSMIVNSQITNHHPVPLGETFRESNMPADNLVSSYNPGVSSSQSIYYFDNKILYELYIERLQRNGQLNPY